MTLQPKSDPRFDLGMPYRLRRALDVSEIGVGEMADHLEVSRNTVSAWINGGSSPRPRDLKQFALKTGFPIEWLRDGTQTLGGGDGGNRLRYFMSPVSDSNRRPPLYIVDGSLGYVWPDEEAA